MATITTSPEERRTLVTGSVDKAIMLGDRLSDLKLIPPYTLCIEEEGESIQNFVERANSYVAKGYTPLGGVAIDDNGYLYQAFYRA